MFEPDDCLMISGLQHFKFCRRQWALIHIEQQWAENIRTTEGEIMHERAHDESLRESRGELVVSRGLRVFSLTLGLAGQCDVVEFRRDDNGVPLNGHEGKWKPYPVEYKRGTAKATAAMSCNSALRRCALKRCCAAIFRRARCITAKTAEGQGSSLLKSSVMKCVIAPSRCMLCIAADILPR